MRHPPLFQMGIGLSPVGVMNEGIAPHPVPLPLGEGTLKFPLRIVQGSLLHPHPLADADTLRFKLAKASLRGEGQDEGSEFRSWQAGATAKAYACANATRPIPSSRTLAP